jgi:hypothetical protein
VFGSSKVVKSQVWLSDLRAYAESDPDDELTMKAQVELTEFKEQVGALPLLVTGGAARIFTTLRVEPRYLEPFVSLVDDVSEGLKEAEGDLSEFRVRDVIGSVGFLASLDLTVSQDMAAVFGAVPTSEYQLSGEAEASVAMTLRMRRSGPSVMLTFVKGPKNPLMSIAGWAATVDECLRASGEGASEFAVPTVGGLDALGEIAETIGQTQGFRQGMEVEQVVAAQTVIGLLSGSD